MPFKLSRSELKELRQAAIDIWSNGCPKKFGNWSRICKRVPVYLDKKRGIVIKRPNFILNTRTPLKLRAPTIKLDKNWVGWVAQPYCEKTRTALAVKLLCIKLGKLHCDLHNLNVGWYDGEPVLFDW